MATAEVAVRAWVNSRSDLVGDPPGSASAPLARGAYLIQQRSPADGAYAVISRQAGDAEPLVAEPSVFDQARIVAAIRAGTVEAAESAANAYAEAVKTLSGAPVVCGDTGVIIRSHMNLTGPQFIQQPGDSGEQYTFEVAADFILQGSS